jgi:hypothetical protein
MSKLDDIFAELGFEKPDLLSQRSRPVPYRSSDYPIGPCGKKVFPSERVAKSAIHNRQNKGTGGNSKILAYFCNECKGWNLTSRLPGRLNR